MLLPVQMLNFLVPTFMKVMLLTSAARALLRNYKVEELG